MTRPERDWIAKKEENTRRSKDAIMARHPDLNALRVSASLLVTVRNPKQTIQRQPENS
jgi:hypothetical protein